MQAIRELREILAGVFALANKAAEQETELRLQVAIVHIGAGDLAVADEMGEANSKLW